MTPDPRQTESIHPAIHPALTKTIRLLARLGQEKFYGKLTIEYQNGNILMIRREENIKP